MLAWLHLNVSASHDRAIQGTLAVPVQYACCMLRVFWLSEEQTPCQGSAAFACSAAVVPCLFAHRTSASAQHVSRKLAYH